VLELRGYIERLSASFRHSEEKRKAQVAVILALAAGCAMRLFYARWAVTDFWGDAYHHWLISRLTLENNWVYADYKGLETVWLPGYHYLTALAMTLFGRPDLGPAHLVNVILGALACGLVTQLVSEITHDWRVGLAAGLTLALLPWHIAYSYINMPEVMAGVLLLLCLLAARRNHAIWLALLAFTGTLTRHELTLLFVAIGLWLLWRQRWSAALGLAAGTVLGLGVWSLWSWHVTGDGLAWWSQYREATAWDARFWAEAGVRLADAQTLLEAARHAFPPLIPVGLVLIGVLVIPQWRKRVPVEGWLLLVLVGFHWLVLGSGFATGHLPSANPRYVLVSLPLLAGAASVTVSAISSKALRALVTGICAVLLLWSLSRELPGFRDMAYVLAPERAAGEYLGAVAAHEGGFWVDAPVSIYFSGLDPERFHSSDGLLPHTLRAPGSDADRALKAILEHNIRFVLWEDVSYTYVQRIWPQMADGRSFEQNGVGFSPVFQYSGWELDYGARPTILWEIAPTPGSTSSSP
jgi:hypothetical protein